MPRDNSHLARAMRDVGEASEDEMPERLRRFLHAFLESTLIAIDDPEDETIETDEGLYLALFTDLIELHMDSPDARWVEIGAEDAIRRVAADEYDGLIINPSGSAFSMSKEEVLDFFDVDPS